MTSQGEKFVVGFDLDGVIIDHTQNKISVAARYGVHLTPEDTHSERMKVFFSPDIYTEIQGLLYDDSDVALSAPLMEGAFATIASLKEGGVDFFLISRRKKPVHAMRLLEKHGLWGTYFTPENTYFVTHIGGKDPVARELGVTHFFDDESRVLALIPSVPNRFLFDARNIFPDAQFSRVQNWGELARVLDILHS